MARSDVPTMAVISEAPQIKMKPVQHRATPHTLWIVKDGNVSASLRLIGVVFILLCKF